MSRQFIGLLDSVEDAAQEVPEGVMCSLHVVGTVLASFGLQRLFLSRKVKVPQVLVFMLTGMVSGLLRSLPKYALHATTPFTSVALGCIGAEIGAHLTFEMLRPHWVSLLAFLGCLVPIVSVTVFSCLYYSGFASGPTAMLIGCIAVETSSPAAIAVIKETRAQGDFTSTAMCLTAALDTVALVLYLTTESAFQSSPLVVVLSHLVGAALIVSSVVYIGVLGLQRLGLGPRLIAGINVVLLVLGEHFLGSDLLLTAIGVGMALNFYHPHPTNAVFESVAMVSRLVLFTLFGMRMHVADMVQQFHISFVLFLVRLGALGVGCAVGNTVTGVKGKGTFRMLCFLTQLAIALTLLHRMGSVFPSEETHTVVVAYSGAVLLNLLAGPWALQFALKKSGDTAYLVL